MAIPAVLTNPVNYGYVWTGHLPVGQNVLDPQRGVVTKRFLAYVENYEQSAHDRNMAAYVQQCGGRPRAPHRAHVFPPNNNATPLTYYANHGQEASILAAAEMQRRWTLAANAGGNATVLQVRRITKEEVFQ